MIEPLRDASRSSEDTITNAWRSALWILEALPATRRPVGPHPSYPLRSRKLVTLVDQLWNFSEAGGIALRSQILSGVPFDQSMRWWAERHQVPAQSLRYSDTLISLAGGRLLAAVGSIASAHAMLVEASSAHVTDRDTSFTEREIRTDIVRGLLRAHSAT